MPRHGPDVMSLVDHQHWHWDATSRRLKRNKHLVRSHRHAKEEDEEEGTKKKGQHFSILGLGP
jgi:hypothetical protein